MNTPAFLERPGVLTGFHFGADQFIASGVWDAAKLTGHSTFDIRLPGNCLYTSGFSFTLPLAAHQCTSRATSGSVSVQNPNKRARGLVIDESLDGKCICMQVSILLRVSRILMLLNSHGCEVP